MEESNNTGVIYLVTNIVNNKKYVGKANSFVKHTRTPQYKHGALGRFKRHLSNANNGNEEIPLLYNDIRTFGSNNFKVEVLEVCLKENLKVKEEYYIRTLQTFKDNVGYNILIGDNKPEDITHKKEYETKKIESNKLRAIGGGLRQSEQTSDLPPNIYKRANGLFAQIKINSILYNKAFLSSKDTDIQKLEKAKLWLAEIKQTHGEIEI
jgi:group I intron endonuclease